MSEQLTMTVDLYQVDPDVLARAAEILKQRAQLVVELEEIFGEQAPKKTKPHANGRSHDFRSGSTGEKVIGLLKTRGSEGMLIKEMAQKLKQKPQSLYTFFSNNKKIPGVKKVAPAHYVMS
jgi:hypothetical protein